MPRPAIRRALRGKRQRVRPVRLGHPRANRQIDDPDVVRQAILHGPLERRDDIADDAHPVLVENLEADEMRGGRDASLSTVRVVTVAGDDSGDVRSVAVVVVRLDAAVDEVHERAHALTTNDARRR